MSQLESTIKELKQWLIECFEWLGDINMSERSHLMTPIKIEREPQDHHRH